MHFLAQYWYMFLICAVGFAIAAIANQVNRMKNIMKGEVNTVLDGILSMFICAIIAGVCVLLTITGIVAHFMKF